MKMPEKPVLPLFLCPASIPIHNDGDMPGQPAFVDMFNHGGHRRQHREVIILNHHPQKD
jgi:hypothetical protein